MNLPPDLEKLFDSEEKDDDSADDLLYEQILYPTNKRDRADILLGGLSDYIAMRRRYGYWILILTSLWIIAVLVVVFMQGFSVKGFVLPDSVLMLLLGTTTANIIGLFIIVANYLFPKNARDLLDSSENGG